jgi:hypothetical protein
MAAAHDQKSEALKARHLACNAGVLKPLHTMPKSRTSPETETAAGCCGDWKKNIEDLGARAQDFARKEPARAVGVAFLAGLMLTVLPVGRLVAVLVRLAFTLIRPVLLILGAVKLCEEIEKRNNP